MLVRYVKERESGDSIDKYLNICEQMGVEPSEESMPVSPEGFPYEVQLAITLYSFLNDRYEGMSGTFLGKDWTLWPYLMEQNKVQDEKEVLLFAKMYEAAIMEFRHDKAAQERKTAERKAKQNNGKSNFKSSRTR